MENYSISGDAEHVDVAAVEQHEIHRETVIKSHPQFFTNQRDGWAKLPLTSESNHAHSSACSVLFSVAPFARRHSTRHTNIHMCPAHRTSPVEHVAIATEDIVGVGSVTDGSTPVQPTKVVTPLAANARGTQSRSSFQNAPKRTTPKREGSEL